MEDLLLHYFILTNSIKAPFSVYPTTHRDAQSRDRGGKHALSSCLALCKSHTNKINNVFDATKPTTSF